MIECHFSSCEHHCSHFGEEGPFCNGEVCIAPAERLTEFSEILVKERRERKWVGMCSTLKPTAS